MDTEFPNQTDPSMPGRFRDSRDYKWLLEVGQWSSRPLSENGQVITRGELDLRLPTRDFRLLSALLQEPGRAYSNQVLSMVVWDESDRDLNAAMNLFRTVSSTGSQACGEGGSGSSRRWSETVLCEAGTWA